MKRLLIAMAAAIVTLSVWSAVTDVITLRDGNVYKGNIWMQLSDGQIRFYADTSIVYLSSSKISRIERLPAKKNDKYPRADIYLVSEKDNVAIIDDEKSVVVDSVCTQGDSAVIAGAIELGNEDSGAQFDVEVLRNVELLEEGSVVKYLDSSPRNILVRLKDVLAITRKPRNPKQLNGLDDEIVTKGRTYKGNIVSTEPGKSLKIESDGRVYSIKLSDVEIQRKVPVDKEEPIFAQSPIIDNIYLRKKDEVIPDVVLIEQDYINGTFDVIDRNNVVTRRPLADIVKIRKEINRQYKPRMEFSFANDSLYINRKSMEGYPYAYKNDKIRLKLSNDVKIQAFKRENGCIKVEGSENTSILRIILMPLGNVCPQDINFKMSHLLADNIPVRLQESDSKDGIILREYSVMPGYYALINTGNSTMIVFRVY